MTASVPLGAAAPPPAADVTVVVTNLRNDRGVVRACLTNQAEKFPTCDDPARSFTAVGAASDSVTLTFRDVPPGRYAVALLHDENGNGQADRAGMMNPTSDYSRARPAWWSRRTRGKG